MTGPDREAALGAGLNVRPARHVACSVVTRAELHGVVGDLVGAFRELPKA